MTSGQSVVSCAVLSVFQMTGQLVDSFLDCVTRHVHILDATVAVKQDFADIVESQDNLRLIHLPSWAGLGAVQYVLFLSLLLHLFLLHCMECRRVLAMRILSVHLSVHLSHA